MGHEIAIAWNRISIRYWLCYKSIVSRCDSQMQNNWKKTNTNVLPDKDKKKRRGVYRGNIENSFRQNQGIPGKQRSQQYS
jgi:hypothetical protein